MQVTIEDISEVKKRLRVELPAAEATAKMEAAYRELAKTARVKGFRPGKVPRTILERAYGGQVEGQVATELIEAAYPEALTQTNISPLGRPIVEEYDLKAGQDFKFSALVEVPPSFEVEGYTGLELEKPKVEVTDDMLDMQLEMLREQHGQMEDVAEPLAPGLWANVDFEATCEGKPVRGLSSKGELLRLSEEGEQSELEKGLVGLRAGEVKDITLHLPPNYHIPSLRDKDVTFKVSVHAVKRKVLPPLDDELARELKFESLERVREQARQELTAKAEATAKRHLRENLVNKLIELAPFEVPESLVEREIEAMVESFKQRLGPRRVDVEDVNLEKVRQNFRPGAERRARADLILARIADKENIQVSDEDVELGIKELAADLNETPERIRDFHEQANLMDSFRRHLREEKTIDFLISQARITEVSPLKEASGK